MKGLILAVLLAAMVLGCGDGADVQAAGNYSMSITNRDNGCNLTNYTVGDTATNIAVVITQAGSEVTVSVNGLAGVALAALLGGGKNVFTGDVDGSALHAESIGSKANTSGNCTYTYNATIKGTLNGDVMTGRIEYRAADNGNSDCTQVHDCLTYQEFNGTRPPQ